MHAAWKFHFWLAGRPVQVSARDSVLTRFIEQSDGISLPGRIVSVPTELMLPAGLALVSLT
jgi:hypothetical protein